MRPAVIFLVHENSALQLAVFLEIVLECDVMRSFQNLLIEVCLRMITFPPHSFNFPRILKGFQLKKMKGDLYIPPGPRSSAILSDSPGWSGLQWGQSCQATPWHGPYPCKAGRRSNPGSRRSSLS